MAASDLCPALWPAVGQYELIRRLAVGGMAEIFLARVPGVGLEGFEKLVVLKRILPQHALDPELLRMFLDEARLSATLTTRTSPRSTTSAPTATRRSSRWSTCTAPTCARSCAPSARRPATRRRRCRSAHALTIVAAAAAGLHHAHERLGPGGEPLGIVHRDVSPSNVLVTLRRRREGVGLRHRQVGLPADAHPGGDAEGQVRLHVARAVPRASRSTGAATSSRWARSSTS